MSQVVLQRLHDEMQVRLARKSLKYFSTYCFQETNEEHHNRWFDELQFGKRDPFGNWYYPSRQLRLAPRGSGKSTCVAKKAPIWILGNNPNVRLLIVTKTGTLARTINRSIRRSVEGNEKISRVFPNLKPSSPWTDDELTVQNSRSDGFPSITAVGLHGTITGRRADRIIVDDIIDKENVWTEASRIKTKEWWDEVVMPILEPNGSIWAIGTRWHQKDIYAQWMENPLWAEDVEVMTAYKTVLNEKGQREMVYDENNKPISYWPSRWTLESLDDRRRELGSLVFNAQYMNDPSGYEGILFKGEWLTHYNSMDAAWQHYLSEEYEVYMGLDPAISESPEADWTAIVVIGLNPTTMDVYILDIYRGHLDFPEQVKKLQEMYAKWRPLKIGIETNVRQALARMGYLSGLPVIEIRQGMNKMSRLIGLSPHFENGRLKLPDPDHEYKTWYDDFVTEYLMYPRGSNDDQLDGLDLAVEVADIQRSRGAFRFG